MALLKTATEEIDLARGDLSSTWEDSKVLSCENAHLAGKLSKAKEELARVVAEAKKSEEAWKGETSSLRAKLEGLCSKVVASQGSLLQAFLYKLIRTNTFGEYLNACGGAIDPLATREAIELISLDHPSLDMKKVDYGYDKDIRE